MVGVPDAQRPSGSSGACWLRKGAYSARSNLAVSLSRSTVRPRTTNSRRSASLAPLSPTALAEAEASAGAAEAELLAMLELERKPQSNPSRPR